MKLTLKNLNKTKVLNIFIPIFLILATLPLLHRNFTARNEYRYIEIANNIIKSKNPFVYYVDNKLYTDKPPLYFWIILVSKFIFGSYSTYGIVFFNIIVESFTLIKLNSFFSKKFGHKISLALLFCIITSILNYISLILVRMDIFLSSFITLSLLSFYECYEIDSYKEVYKTYIYAGLAFLFKGLVGILTPLLTIIFFKFSSKRKYSFKDIKFIEGNLIICLFILFWLLPAYLTTGYSFIENLFMKQIFSRTVTGFVHKEPFYYYLVLFPVIFFPWTIAVIYAAYKYIKDFIQKKKFSDLEIFLIIWISTTVFYLSMSKSKLIIYLLPVITPGIILAFIKFEKSDMKTRNRIYYVTLAVFLYITAVLPFMNGRDIVPFKGIAEICFITNFLTSFLLFLKGYKKIAFYSFGLLVIFLSVVTGINMKYINNQIKSGKKSTYSYMKDFNFLSTRKETQHG